ncbi:MAG: orotidine-5'-phosphate decarboxylase [Verrucomicrobiia bacterium]
MMKRDELILALDVPSDREALGWVDRLAGQVGYFKVGLQLFTAYGPELVREVRARGGRVFLDLKLHDIPNTVAKAVEAAGPLGVSFLTLHASGGRAMLREAAEAAAGYSGLRLLAVTVLTSLTEGDLDELGFDHSALGLAAHLGRLAAEAGVTGLVCSPREVEVLRRELPESVLVTPGVRPPGAEVDDQARVATPEAALAAGASHVVMGRPILRAPDPEGLVRELLGEVR